MINTNNEWDTLRRVIVGTATNAHWPTKCPIFRNLENTTLWKSSPVPSGPVIQKVIDETNEDLETFVNVLKRLDVVVERPTNLDFQSFDGMYNYCPRDRILIIGNTVVDAAITYPTRKNEIHALQHLLPDNVLSCEKFDVKFDAANICRLGKDLLYLVSESGNIAGAKWLQDNFKEYAIHILDNIYSGVHIDSTISPVREGLVVVNADRINKDNMPDVFKSWNIINISGNQIVEQSFIDYPYASKYIALNFLTVNPNLVICDPYQTTLRKQLEKFGVETIGVNLRHSRTLGGGHHCVTLDLERLN